jgi:6-phosphofructokinase
MGAGLDDPIVCIGIPKTIDNDLPITDCCAGSGSVAKYLATSLREAAFDLAHETLRPGVRICARCRFRDPEKSLSDDRS